MQQTTSPLPRIQTNVPCGMLKYTHTLHIFEAFYACEWSLLFYIFITNDRHAKDNTPLRSFYHSIVKGILTSCSQMLLFTVFIFTLRIAIFK